MAIRIGKKDVVWGYISTFINSGINLIILPFILKLLPSNELGLWYTFTSIGALAALLDFGFTTTITRNVSYAWSGAKKIQRKGIGGGENDNEPNLNLFSEVFQVSRIIYIITSTLVIVVLSTLGTVYINSIASKIVDKQEYLLAWGIYIVAVFLNIYYAYWTPVLKGIGAIKQDYQSVVFSKILQFAVSITGLLLGYKLMAVAVGYLIGLVARRLISKYMFLHYDDVREVHYTIKSHKVSKEKLLVTFKSMWPNAYRQGIMSLSKYMTDKVSILICSASLGLKMSAVLGLSMQLLDLLGTVGTVLYNTYLPLFSQLRVKNDVRTSYRLFSMSVGIQSIVVIAGGIALVLLGNPLLEFFGIQSRILPLLACFVLLLFYFLHCNQNIFVSYIITSNEMPMFRPYIIFAFINVASLVVFALTLNSWGIWSIILPLLIVEISYNGWKWPLYVVNQFNVSIGKFYVDSFANVKNVFNKEMRAAK